MPDASFPDLERCGLRVDWSAGRCPPWSSHSIFAIQRGDIEELRLLRFMRVVGPGKDPQVLHDPAPELPARDHPLDGLLDDALWVSAVEDGTLAAPLDPAGVAGMPIEDAVGPLVAGQLNLLGIDDNDIVTTIHMRCEGWFVLTAQPNRDDRCKPTQHQPVGVDQQPFLVYIRRFGGERLHCLCDNTGGPGRRSCKRSRPDGQVRRWLTRGRQWRQC